MAALRPLLVMSTMQLPHKLWLYLVSLSVKFPHCLTVLLDDLSIPVQALMGSELRIIWSV